MKVKEVIDKLYDFNSDADVYVNAHCKRESFSFSFGGGDGCKNAIDGNGKSRWTTGGNQTPGQWFQIELPKVSKVGEIILDSRNSGADYPRGFEVTVSLDGKRWSKPLAKGSGNTALTTIGLPLVEAKFIRITQTGSVNGKHWSIHDLQIKGKEL